MIKIVNILPVLSESIDSLYRSHFSGSALDDIGRERVDHCHTCKISLIYFRYPSYCEPVEQTWLSLQMGYVLYLSNVQHTL